MEYDVVGYTMKSENITPIIDVDYRVIDETEKAKPKKKVARKRKYSESFSLKLIKVIIAYILILFVTVGVMFVVWNFALVQTFQVMWSVL